MAKMKFKRTEFDPKALDAPYDPGERRQNYLGEIPKTGTPLNMRVTKAWMTLSSGGDQQTKLLLIAEQNDGKYEEFNGLPVWEPLTWSKPSARRYMAFLTNFDLTTHDVSRRASRPPASPRQARRSIPPPCRTRARAG